MELIWEGLSEACRLIFTFDPVVMAAALRSLWISGLAVVVAAAVGLPVGTLLASLRFPGRRLVVLGFRGGMAVPTVFIGVLCYAIFSRRGPLGAADLMFTPWVIMAGEFLLALPILVSITHGALNALDRRVGETAYTLGATLLRRWCTYLSEARVGVTLAVLTAFARCVTELGIAIMVGGNIRGRTQTLATATAEQTRQGEFALGLAMGMILVLVSLLVTVFIVSLSREERS